MRDLAAAVVRSLGAAVAYASTTSTRPISVPSDRESISPLA